MSDSHESTTQIRGAEALETLRLGTGFALDERPQIIHQFQALGTRLTSFKTDGMDMELSIKERDGVDQRITLELWIPGEQKLVASSSRPDVQAALQEVRDDMVRQVSDLADR